YSTTPLFHYSTILLLYYSTILLFTTHNSLNSGKHLDSARCDKESLPKSRDCSMFRSRCFGPDVSGARCDIELPVSYPPVSCRAVPMSRERHQPKPSKPEPPGVMRFLIVPIPRLRDGAARCDNTTLSTILLFHYSSILLFYLNSDSTSTSSV